MAEKLPSEIAENSGGLDYSLLTDDRTPISELKTISGKVKTFAEMSTNSTIAGILLAFKSMCMTVKFSVEENKKDPDKKRAKENAEYVQECLDDMQTSFSEVMGEILEMIGMGFKVIIPQFKLRSGFDFNANFNSKHNDGKVAWKNFLPIKPNSIFKWNGPEGSGYLGLTGITQQIARNGTYVQIPRNRLLIFRNSSSDNSPIGKSILEGAYKDWVKLIQVIEIQMIGLRRSLEGVPYGLISTDMMASDRKGDQDGVRAVQAAVRNLDATLDRGFLLPGDRDDQGHLKCEVRMMGAQEGGGNTKIQDAQVIIDAKEQTIARSMLAQFMTISGKGGSYALSKNQSDVFVNSLKGSMDQIAGVMNNEAIPRLFALQDQMFGTKTEYMPRLVFSDFIKEDATEFFASIEKAINIGLFKATPELQRKAAQILNVGAGGQEEGLEEREADLKELKEIAKQSQIDIASNSGDTETPIASGGDDVPPTTKSDIKDPVLNKILDE